MDDFFLSFRDLYGSEKLQDKVSANREAYKRQFSMSAPRLLSSTGESIFAAAEKIDGALSGIPESAGVHEGRARVLNSPEESTKIEKGDILVTRGTNPAWTPIFLNLGAIVMETGGPISHGAVVAREYGVPAVVGVGEATKLISDGQIVRVNGETAVRDGSALLYKQGLRSGRHQCSDRSQHSSGRQLLYPALRNS